MGIKKRFQNRYWEVDFVRGVAIILMITLHLLDDIFLLRMFNFKLNWNLWFFWQRITASLFLSLVGVSLTLSRFSNQKYREDKDNRLFQRYLKRGLTVFSLGLVITLVTRIYLGEDFVLFGILHLIGVSIICSYPFLKLRYWNLVLGVTVIIIGIYLQQFRFSFPWLLWAGFVPQDFSSVDYFPVFPWFGAVLIGLFLGNTLYSEDGRRFPFPDYSCVFLVKQLCYLGKHSLVIYLVHQPVFILGLSVVKFLGG